MNVKRYGRIGSMMEATPQILELYPEATVYVLATDFDRVTAERDDLQQRLNTADELNDSLRDRKNSIVALQKQVAELTAKNQLLSKLLEQTLAALNPKARLAKSIKAALNPTTEAEPKSHRGHCKSCAMEYSAANHPVCPICTRTTEAGDIWPAVSP